MTIRRVLVIPIVLALGSCAGERTADAPAAQEDLAQLMERVAAVDGLAGPEGVRYDPEQDVYFVSNFNGEPAGDRNGFISRIGPDGAILSREFMTGTARAPLHGPRGMFLTGDTLWAADANGVHAFHRRTGRPLAFVDFSSFSPGFLNDIARGPDGALYVTDTDRSRIFRVAGGNVTIALEDTSLCGPNGITWDAGERRFLLASWGRGPRLQGWRPGTRDIQKLGSVARGGFDGIETVGGRIVVASQADSSLHEFGQAGERVLLQLVGAPADFGVDTRRGRVAVPMVDRNQVEIWQLAATSPRDSLSP